MPIDLVQEHDGVAEVVIDHPPVNALDVETWFTLADALTAAGRVPTNRVVILRATGRGFCAGVDIKEVNAKGDEALVGVNRGCAAAFAAVYDCEVPVIAAVQGFCLGGGIGLVGNADIIVASQDATFGLPEVDRGALGAATHLARLVPQHTMRKMVYTAKPVTADELASYGSVAAVVPPDRLLAATLELAEEIAAKSPTIIRRAKESLTASTRSTSSAAIASSRGSPMSSMSGAWRTSSAPPSSRSATPTPPGEASVTPVWTAGLG